MILTQSATLLSPRAFKALGIEEIAYVKPIVDDTGSTYAIHAADGTRLAIVEDRLVAFATIRRTTSNPRARTRPAKSTGTPPRPSRET
jgi:hypothetical protein